MTLPATETSFLPGKLGAAYGAFKFRHITPTLLLQNLLVLIIFLFHMQGNPAFQIRFMQEILSFFNVFNCFCIISCNYAHHPPKKAYNLKFNIVKNSFFSLQS